MNQVKLVFTGPPRVGKTTLKKRLMQKICNLTTHPDTSPSTGIDKPKVLYIGCTAFGIAPSGSPGDASWEWKEVNLPNQISILLESIRVLPQKNKEQAPQVIEEESITKTNIPKEERSKKVDQISESPTPSPSVLYESSPIADEVEKTRSTSGSTQPIPAPVPHPELPERVKIVAHDIKWEKVREELRTLEEETTIYVMDTGGQPEFHEVLPHVLKGPALHLVLFSLEEDKATGKDCLDRCFNVEYVSQDLKSAIPYESACPVSEVHLPTSCQLLLNSPS